MVNECFKSGVKFSQKKLESQNLYNASFVFTGTLKTIKRAKAKNYVESHGGRVSSSVSKNTNYLVYAPLPTSQLRHEECRRLQ